MGVRYSLRAILVAFLLASCERKQNARPLFELLAPSATGVTFANKLPETGFNIVNYLYYYNGGGVAVGDVDGDGLPDLYFTSNIGPNKLYRNKGNYQFEDITEKKSTRLNSSHLAISYAVFCLKKHSRARHHFGREMNATSAASWKELSSAGG